jgi:hypothetical protein
MDFHHYVTAVLHYCPDSGDDNATLFCQYSPSTNHVKGCKMRLTTEQQKFLAQAKALGFETDRSNRVIIPLYDERMFQLNIEVECAEMIKFVLPQEREHTLAAHQVI